MDAGDFGGLDAVFAEDAAGAGGRIDLETQLFRHGPGGADEAVLPPRRPEREQDALLRPPEPGGQQAVEERLVEGIPETSHFAGAGHFHPEQRVGATQPRERELRHLDAYVLEFVERTVLHPRIGPQHDAGGRFGVVAPGHLGYEGQTP